MFNSNAFKTSLIFLGIILVTIIFHMFASGDSLFVNIHESEQTANSLCSQDERYC